MIGVHFGFVCTGIHGQKWLNAASCIALLLRTLYIHYFFQCFFHYILCEKICDMRIKNFLAVRLRAIAVIITTIGRSDI